MAKGFQTRPLTALTEVGGSSPGVLVLQIAPRAAARRQSGPITSSAPVWGIPPNLARLLLEDFDGYLHARPTCHPCSAVRECLSRRSLAIFLHTRLAHISGQPRGDRPLFVERRSCIRQESLLK